MSKYIKISVLGLTLFSVSACSHKTTSLVPDQGRLIATGGVSQLEGSAGGGLTPWSIITGYGTEKSYGTNSFYTRSNLNDFDFQSYGAAVGIADRVEISVARQELDTGGTGPLLGLDEGYTFKQDIIGAKIRVIGNAVYDQDTWVPQIAIGAQYKKVNAFNAPLTEALGAVDDDGVDVYISATKLFLDKNILLTGTLRGTRANQFGLLGFGGDLNNNYQIELEATAAYMVNRRLVIGADYRTKPNNLGFAEETDAKAAYLAFFPTKNLSLTLAAVDLGQVALQGRQRGVYLSTQVGF